MTFIRQKGLGAARLAASVVALAAIVAGATGIVAGRGNAATPEKPDKGSCPVDELKFKEPKLKHGVLEVKGTHESDTVALRLQAGQPSVLEVDVGDDGSADFTFDRASVAAIDVDARGGDDVVRIDESQGAFTDAIPTSIDGGDGDDTLTGGKGIETFAGGDGDDTIDGNGGNDTALMGAGDDTFVWDPGDGSDTLEGQDGADTMVFNGAGGAEQVDLSANGNRLRFFRVQATITMDTAGVERVDFNALGGVDLITVNDLSGTDVTDLRLDLAAALGGTTGDAAIDRVVVNGTGSSDAITVGGNTDGVTVTGLQPLVAIQHQEPADRLDVNALAGDDAIDASGLAAGSISLAVDGGAGNDTVAGGAGAETSTGGDGNDSIDGNGGADTALMGAGDDVFVWDPGDGSDVVEGQGGADVMVFNGAGGAEQVELSANGNRLKFVRTQGAITMDTAGVEGVDFNALGGADTVTVNDLTGTDVTDLRVDLAAAIGGVTGDAAADRIVVNGTAGNDVIAVSGAVGALTVSGLDPRIRILHSEVANDRLEINTLAGIDVVDSGALAAGAIQLLVDGVPVP